jgi:hypothetical protein
VTRDQGLARILESAWSIISNPVFDRIGALLITDPDINLKEEIEKFSNN